MEFSCQDEKVNLAIKAARLLRQAKGLPEERNVSVLYEEIAEQLGLPRKIHASKPVPSVRDVTGKVFPSPTKPCPECKREGTYKLWPLCGTCAEAEKGKYKTAYKCSKCGFIGDKSDKAYLAVLKELGLVVPVGNKKDTGILTITDDGLK